ncbi:hypothetical protein E1H18_627 [Caulobacter sp. RHG1]|nr:hypothetical protein [Caulobacter sp. RHG1]
MVLGKIVLACVCLAIADHRKSGDAVAFLRQLSAMSITNLQ